MPTIQILFGITIIMNQTGKEHEPPHIHAMHGERKGVFVLSSGEMIQGDLKKPQQRIVKQFIDTYREELTKMWIEEKPRRIK